MHIKKTEMVTKEVEVVLESYHVCDKCGVKVDSRYDGDYETFKIEHEKGWRYGNEGASKAVFAELCSKCAEDVMQKIKELGVKFQIEERDY